MTSTNDGSWPSVVSRNCRHVLCVRQASWAACLHSAQPRAGMFPRAKLAYGASIWKIRRAAATRSIKSGPSISAAICSRRSGIWMCCGHLSRQSPHCDALGSVARPAVGQLAAEAEGVGELRLILAAEHVHRVVVLEAPGNGHFGRARHAVSATGAAGLHQLAIRLSDPLHKVQLLSGQDAGLCGAGDGQVLADLGVVVHAGEDHGDFRAGSRSSAGPTRPASAGLGLAPQGRNGGRRHGQSQTAAAQRLHDDHSQTLGGGVLEPLGPRLIVLVQVVVLNLAEDPGMNVHNPLELVGQSVEGEAGMADTPILLCLV